MKKRVLSMILTAAMCLGTTGSTVGAATADFGSEIQAEAEETQETDTEIMGVTLCYLRVCTGDADGRDTCLLEYVRSCDGYAGTVGTKYYGYLVSYQLSRCGGSLVV